MNNCEDFKYNLSMIVIILLLIIFMAGEKGGRRASQPEAIPVG